MPRVQATAPNDILMEWYLVHSPRSSSTRPGSGPFPPCLEASSLILKMLLFVGLTVLGWFVSSTLTWYRVNRYSHTVNVYGRGANAKKDAPYKIGRRSGRNVEATK